MVDATTPFHRRDIEVLVVDTIVGAVGFEGALAKGTTSICDYEDICI